MRSDQKVLPKFPHLHPIAIITKNLLLIVIKRMGFNDKDFRLVGQIREEIEKVKPCVLATT